MMSSMAATLILEQKGANTMKGSIARGIMVVSLGLFASVPASAAEGLVVPQSQLQHQEKLQVLPKANAAKSVKVDQLQDSALIEYKGRKMTVAQAKQQAKTREAAARRAFIAKIDGELNALRKQAKSRSSSRQSAPAPGGGLVAGNQPGSVRPPSVLTQDEPTGSSVYCDHPQVNAVSPAVVYPGDTLQIKGCGFLAQPGQAFVIVDGQERYLTINSWSATEISGALPSLTGFSTPRRSRPPSKPRWVSKANSHRASR